MKTISAFFWGREGSFDEALRCYNLGRELLEDMRSLAQRKLTAVGLAPDGERKVITPFAWINLWPMFATNRARGRNNQYTEVEVFEGLSSENRGQKILLDCVDWLCIQRAENPDEPKKVLIFHAQKNFGGQLTVAIFNVAYKIVALTAVPSRSVNTMSGVPICPPF